MLLLFSIRVAERPPVWGRAVHSVYLWLFSLYINIKIGKNSC